MRYVSLTDNFTLEEWFAQLAREENPNNTILISCDVCASWLPATANKKDTEMWKLNHFRCGRDVAEVDDTVTDWLNTI